MIWLLRGLAALLGVTRLWGAYQAWRSNRQAINHAEEVGKKHRREKEIFSQPRRSKRAVADKLRSLRDD